jgi:RIO-like serine/threonine protein kinase
MKDAETRLLRFLHAEKTRGEWIPYSSIRNTEALRSGDEKALPALLERGFVEQDSLKPLYRISTRGAKALQRRSDYL